MSTCLCVACYVCVCACVSLYFKLGNIGIFFYYCRQVVDCIDSNFMPRQCCVHCHLNLLPHDSWFDSLSIKVKKKEEYTYTYAWWSTAITMILYARYMSMCVCVIRVCLCNSLPIPMGDAIISIICKCHLICTNVIEFLCYHILKFT